MRPLAGVLLLIIVIISLWTVIGLPSVTHRWFSSGYLRSETTEPAYAERQSASAIDPYAFHLSGWLKTEAAKSRKQRRNLKQLHEDLTELGFKGSHDRVAAFARQWREGQTEWGNSARKRTTETTFALAKTS